MVAGNKVSLEEMRRVLQQDRKNVEKVEIAQADIDAETGRVRVYNTTIEALGEEVRKEAITKMKPAIVQAVAKATDQEAERISRTLDEKFNNAHNDLLALAESVRPIEIRSAGGIKKLKGVQHGEFQKLLTAVNCGLPVLMVGPAGTGKTHSAELVAEALNLDFYSISVGSQTSKSDLQGYMDATHTYVRTQFRNAYELGGIFLLDEADAGNSNVLILLNAALSNGYMAFPDKMVEVHKDFRMIATANTFGYGANRQYVGRNQLDAATLDRFTVLTWDIDPRVEEAMSAGNTKWLAAVRAVRNKVLKELDIRVVISPRATQRGATLLAAGMPFDQVLPMALTGNLPNSEREGLENLARAAYNKV